MTGLDSDDEKKIYEKLEDIDNKIERIKSDTHSLNRIFSIAHAPVVIQELKKIIKRSKLRAAILHYTKEEICAGDLSEKLGIDSANLAKAMAPLLGNKSYITETRKGRNRFFQRAGLLDSIGYESIPYFSDLITKWDEKEKNR